MNLPTGASPWVRCPGTVAHSGREWKDVDDAGLRHYLEYTQMITGKERVYGCDRAVRPQTHDKRRTRLFKPDCRNGMAQSAWTPCWWITWAQRTTYIPGRSPESPCRLLWPRVMGARLQVRLYAHPGRAAGHRQKHFFGSLLGKQWYSDSLTTFEGKEASEMIQGVWINELGELNGLSRSETNAVKAVS